MSTTQGKADRRWADIQATRNKMANGEPIPGTVAFAYFFNPQMVRLDPVFVLSRSLEGRVMVQDRIGGAHREVELHSLRSEGEIWDTANRLEPGSTPKRKPAKHETPWNPNSLSKSLIAKIIRET